jgi:hypothetical protein
MIDQNIVTDIDNYKHKHISKKTIERSFPSNEVEKILTTYMSVENYSENYKHVMECINGLTKTVSTIATSIEPIIASWKNNGCCIDLYEVC